MKKLIPLLAQKQPRLEPSMIRQISRITLLLVGVLIGDPTLGQILATPNRIIVRNVFLDKENANIVHALMYKNTKASVQFENITGGLLYAQLKLYGGISDREVVVSGFCLSACANIALSAKKLVFQRGGDTLPILMIHGIFSSTTLDWQESSKNDIEWLAAKLPNVPTQAISAALHFRTPDMRGLFITPDVGNSNLISVKLCDPFPENCRAVRYFSPADTRMSIEPK